MSDRGLSNRFCPLCGVFSQSEPLADSGACRPCDRRLSREYNVARLVDHATEPGISATEW
jgi:hypothetical protein